MDCRLPIIFVGGLSAATATTVVDYELCHETANRLLLKSPSFFEHKSPLKHIYPFEDYCSYSNFVEDENGQFKYLVDSEYISKIDEITKINILTDFADTISNSIAEVDPKISKVVGDNFWSLI